MGRAGFMLFLPGSAALLKPTHLVVVQAGPVPSPSASLRFLPAVKPCSPLPRQHWVPCCSRSSGSLLPRRYFYTSLKIQR